MEEITCGPIEPDEQSVRIAEREWALLQLVQNAGGPADCQSDRETFMIMRCSQFMTWTPAAKSSYEQDLEAAAAQGRNLLADKFARMMRYTHPAEYAQLKHRLPELTAEAEALIDAIVAIVLGWSLDMKSKYPWLMATSRPVFSAQDRLATSIETYTRGELATYGVRTLRLILDHYTKVNAQGINLHEVTDCFTVRFYGYASLAQADEMIGKQLNGG